MAIVGGGAQAELAVVHERQLMPVPDVLDWPAAGGLPEVFTTAHDALFTQAGLRPGERLLVHGGAGGVGTAAIQLARAAGASVTATVRNEQLREQVAALGAAAIAPEGFAEHGPFDVVLELVGAPNLPDERERARDRRADRRDRGLGRRQGRAQPARADGKARRIHGVHAARAPARGEGARLAARRSTRCCRCSSRAPCACRSPRRSRSRTPPPPTTASRPAASSARSCCSPSTAAVPRTTRRARGTTPRSRAWRPARRASRRCPARTGRPPWG